MRGSGEPGGQCEPGCAVRTSGPSLRGCFSLLCICRGQRGACSGASSGASVSELLEHTGLLVSASSVAVPGP